MISDDQLKRILSICEWHDELNRAYAVSEKILEQMATELLVYREEKRKAEESRAASWKGAPEWAHWKAADRDGSTMLYEIEPMPCGDEWMPPTGAGRIVRFVGPVLDWETTLEPRP